MFIGLSEDVFVRPLAVKDASLYYLFDSQTGRLKYSFVIWPDGSVDIVDDRWGHLTYLTRCDEFESFGRFLRNIYIEVNL